MLGGAEAFPVEWLSVLDGVDRLEWVHLVPVHGPPQESRAYLRDARALLSAVVAYVRAGIESNTDIETLSLGSSFCEYAP